MVSMDYDRLKKQLECFLRVVYSQIQGSVEDIPVTIVRTEEVVEVGSEESDASMQTKYSLREKKKLVDYLIFQTDALESERATKLVQFIEEESGLEIDDDYLRRLVLDVFGEETEHVDDWESRIDEASRKLRHDMENRTPVHLVKNHLRGVNLEVDEVELVHGLKLRKSKPEDFTREQEVASPSYISPNMGIPPTVAEFEAEPRFGRYPPGQARTDLLTTVLKLYGAGNVHTVRRENLPQTYLGVRSKGSPNSSQSRHPKYSIDGSDSQAISNLYSLLGKHYSGEDMEFEYPLGVAIDHFESSIEKRTQTRESVTFSIIGLESLFTQGRGKVSTHCAFLLGSCHPDLEPGEMQDHLSDAYDFRSGWVHGGRRKSKKKHLQEKLWDYLRISIIIFAWLIDKEVFEAKKSGRTSNRDIINDALVNNEAREDLLAELDELELENYRQMETVS